MAIGGHHVFVLNWYHFLLVLPPIVAVLRHFQGNHFLFCWKSWMSFLIMILLFFKRRTRGAFPCKQKKSGLNFRHFQLRMEQHFPETPRKPYTQIFVNILFFRISVPWEFCDFERIGLHFGNWTMLGFFRKLFRKISVPFAIISNFPEFWLEWELSRVRLSSLPEIPESDVSFATGNNKKWNWNFSTNGQCSRKTGLLAWYNNEA